MKRILCIMIVPILLISLTACGQSGPTWQEQYDLGVRYLSEGNYEEAILAFTAAIEIDPKQALAYVGRGDAYVLTGETEENLAAAQADYEKAIELNETLAEAYLGLADVYIRRGEYDRALEVLQNGLKAAGNAQELVDKISELEAGNYLDSQGNQRRMAYYDANGNVLWWHDYTYNLQGQATMVTVFDAAGNKIDAWDGFQYDSQGRQIRNVGWRGDTGEFVSIQEWKYEDDVIVRQDMYEMDGRHSSYSLFEYDNNENNTKTIDYSDDGEMMGYAIFTYNEKGEMIRDDHYNWNDTFIGHGEPIYDATGKQIGYYFYDADGNLDSYSEG